MAAVLRPHGALARVPTAAVWIFRLEWSVSGLQEARPALAGYRIRNRLAVMPYDSPQGRPNRHQST